ncbi:MAG: glycine--tRNA ligase subunit beta [Nitrospiraceae bacterium]
MRTGRRNSARPTPLTGIVGEFPTLQGIMGGEYAAHDGERPAVSQAIREQYMPRAMEGDLPESLAGKVLSLADRFDTVTAFFGLVPWLRGSLALRRHATGNRVILTERKLRLDLAQVIGLAQEQLAKQSVAPAASGGKGGAPDTVGFPFERVRY